MANSQSEQVRQIVDQLRKNQLEFEAKQAELRLKLHELFGCGPGKPEREIVKEIVDFFLFPNS